MSFFKAIIIKLAVLVFLTPWVCFSATGVKTSYKEYSLFTYNERVYLCEPYLVQNNDWLYKIFRQKGEISASDFPLFLKIFKTINPQISNIDAITAGSRILIPLKQVDKNAYQEHSNGIVQVPVLEFSSKIEPAAISGHTHKHEVKAGDTISGLLSKEFLTSGGNVSKTGEKAILHLNPSIKNINCIYQGASIVIPDPSILSQPWFKDFLAMGQEGAFRPARTSPPTDAVPPAEPPPPSRAVPTYIPEKELTDSRAPKALSMQDIAQLKRYTQLIRGHIMHQGKLFFPPADHGRKPESIDLSKTPVISDGSGRKTVLLGPGITEDSMNPDLVAAMKAYWKDLQFKKFSEILNTKIRPEAQAMKGAPKSPKSLIRILLATTSYSYEPQVFFPLSLNNVQVTVSLGRITHDNSPDILINSGSVYGKALNILKKQGYQILDLPSDLSFEDICTRLFSQLGYQVLKDPPFNADHKVRIIPGVYAEKGMERLFLTRTPLFKNAVTFLRNENIEVIMLDKEPAR